MVSALIIQSLFSRRAFWEFPLMEGQIDSYEIVITAFLSNERNHQIAKEDRVRQLIQAVSTIRTWAGGGEQSNQTVSDYSTSLSVICLRCSLASCFYLLPVSAVTDGAFGGIRASCQSCQPLIPLSGLPVQGQIALPQMNGSRWLLKKTNLIETLRATEWFHLHTPHVRRPGIELTNNLLLIN